MRRSSCGRVKDYEEKFGIRFIGWFNVAYGWDFDNVILLDLPDYATSTSSRQTRPPAPSAIAPASGSSSAIIRCSCERMGPDLEYHP
jgi:hypothetical protein